MGNIKRTSSNSARAIRRYALHPDELLIAVESAVESLHRWELLVSHGRGLRAVRRSRLFRRKHIITVRIVDRDEGSEASFESVSQTGGYDLGKNRRNLLKLLDAVDRELRKPVPQPEASL